MLKTFKATKTLAVIIVLLFIVGVIIPEIAESKYFIQVYIFCGLIVTLTFLFLIGTGEERFNKDVNSSLLLVNLVLLLVNLIIIAFEIFIVLL